MPRVSFVQPLENFHLSVVFDDGTQGTVALADRLFGPVFEPLRDPEMFKQVFVDEFGAIAWPNGADLAPMCVYEKLRAASVVRS